MTKKHLQVRAHFMTALLLRVQFKKYLRNEHNVTMSEYCELSACSVAEKLANAFKNDEAQLLPSLHHEFTLSMCTYSMNYPAIGSVSPNHVPGTRWLLSKLCSFFGSSMVVECKHKRFGSLALYRHCDILKALLERG